MLHKIPHWVQGLFPAFTWQIKSNQKTIYLTFDDGPIPTITEWVLNVLDEYKAKASFFVVGENVARYPTIFNKLLKAGHTIGNHTYSHIKGWHSTHNIYFDNVEKCTQLLVAHGAGYPRYFRPPHGRIKPSQAKELRKNYELVMWSVLSVDYNKKLGAKNCLSNTIKATRSGSIVVFHDSVKAEKNLKYVLPKYLEHFAKKGYSFKKL